MTWLHRLLNSLRLLIGISKGVYILKHLAFYCRAYVFCYLESIIFLSQGMILEGRRKHNKRGERVSLRAAFKEFLLYLFPVLLYLLFLAT